MGIVKQLQQKNNTGSGIVGQLKQNQNIFQPANQTLTGEDNPIGSLPIIKQATQLGVGIGTGVGKSLLNIPKAGLKLSQGISNIGSKIMGTQPADYSKAIKAVDTLSNDLFQKPYETELKTVGGKIGETIGQTVPYFTGIGGATSKISNVASGTKILQGNGLPKMLGRIGAGAGAEGIANLGAGYALSGGDIEKAKNQALVAGALKTGFSTIGEIANAIKLPESMVGKIFQTNKKEVENIFKGVDKNGTLGKEVLDRGHYGNSPKLAQEFIDGMKESETKIAQEFRKAGNPQIKLNNPEMTIKYLKDKASMFRKAGATEVADGIDSSIPAISPNGEISANNALSLRRFLSGLRTEKSRLVPSEELAAQQAGLAQMEKELINKVNSIGITGDIMKDYQFYIRAMEKLTEHAVRTKNNNALGLINSFLLGQGIAQLNPAFAGVVGARAMLGSPRGATQGAKILKNLPKSSETGSTVRSLLGTKLSGQ